MIGRRKLCAERSGTKHKSRGLTLLELLLVMSMVGILTCLTTWGGSLFTRGYHLKRAGHQLLEDLKAAQAQAEMSGSLIVSNGALIMQRTFLVFDPAAQSYLAYHWQDLDGDGTAGAGESDQLWRKSLPPGVTFAWTSDIDRRACSNVAGSPSGAISFSSPLYEPCNDRPCIKFDQYGFSVMGPGAIYLSDREETLAITGTRPGHFTMCEWGGDLWR